MTIPQYEYLLNFFFGGMGTGKGSGCIIDTSEPVPDDHGYLASGTVIQNMQPCEVLKAILYPFLPPSFTNFFIESQATTLEVGQTIHGGNRTFRWTTKNAIYLKPNSIQIQDVNVNSVLGAGLADDGQEVLDIGTDKVSSVPGEYRWRILGEDTQNNTVQTDFVVNWYYRIFWGNSVNSSLTENDIKLLVNNDLRPDFKGVFNFVNGGNLEYYYIVYPDVWGDIGNWIDTDTSFPVDYTYAGTVDVTNNYGVTVTYRLVRTTYKQNADLHSNVI